MSKRPTVQRERDLGSLCCEPNDPPKLKSLKLGARIRIAIPLSLSIIVLEVSLPPAVLLLG